MDFQSLARRELQALCKKNKIPANMTNVAMADALKALQTVEGLEELLNSSESQNPQSPEKPEIGSPPEVPRTCHTSTRRRVIKAAEEPESCQILTRTRRGIRRNIVEEVNQEKSEAVQTPGVPSSRKGVPAASTRQRTTRAEQKSVQHAYSTRRSARLSEKLGRTPMEVEFSKVMTKDLVEDEENKGRTGMEVEFSKVMTKVSVEEEENKESDLQTISEESSKITDDLEAVTDEISIEVSSDYRAKTGDSSDCIEVSEDQDKASYEQENTCKSSKIPDSEIGKDLLPVQHDSKAEAEVKAEESAKLDDLDFLEVSEAKDEEGLDEQNKEADMQENSDVDCEKMDESKSLKVSVHLNDEIEEVVDISSVTMTNNEDDFTEMENEQQQLVGSDLTLDLSVPPQADNSSCDSEKPELIFPAIADEVVCQNPVIEDSKNEGGFGEVDHGKAAADYMDSNRKAIRLGIDAPPPQATVDDDSSCESEKQQFSFSLMGKSPDEIVESQDPVSMDSAMNVTSEESNDDDDGEAADDADELFDMDLYQKAAADLPGLDFTDDSSSDPGKPELSLNSWIHSTGSDSSIDVDQTESPVKLEFSNHGSLNFEDVPPPSGKPESEENAAEKGTEAEEFLPFLKSFPTPVKVMSPHRPKSNTAVSGRTPLSPLAAGSQLPGQAMSTPTRKSSSKKPQPPPLAATQKMMILISDNKEIKQAMSTPTRKSSSKKPQPPPSAVTQKMMILISDNKENLDSTGRKLVVVKPEMGKKRSTGEDIKPKKLTDTSLRQLRKMFKEKLQIKENANKSSTENSDELMRPGLQTLAENCHMAKVEAGN